MKKTLIIFTLTLFACGFLWPQKSTGSLTLQKSELQQILEQHPDYEGLAFKLLSPANMDIEVLGVKDEARTLIAETLQLKNKGTYVPYEKIKNQEIFSFHYEPKIPTLQMEIH